MTGGLLLGPKDHEQMQSLLTNSVQKEDEVIDAPEMMRRYSALKVPANYVGIATKDMGFFNIKRVLAVLKRLCIENGAQLYYGMKMQEILA